MLIPLELRRVSLLALLTATSVSAQADLRGDAAQASAEALSARQGQTSYELLHVIERPGLGNYGLWLNGNEADGAGYCEVRRGELARVVERDVPWSRARIGDPEAVQLSGLN